MMGRFSCGVNSCRFKFSSGVEHIDHLIQHHGFRSSSDSSTHSQCSVAVSSEQEASIPTVIFQDPSQDYDVYVSYCPENCSGGTSCSSQYHDPMQITAELSRHFKPWFASVSLGPQSTGDFYDDRALHLQKVKLFVALLSPEYCMDDQCKMEYQFAFKSLKKPVLPVLIRPGEICPTIDSYIKQDGRVPFLMNVPITQDVEFKEKMGFLVGAIKSMLGMVDTEVASTRLNHLTIQDSSEASAPPTYSEVIAMQTANLDESIRDKVPKVGDYVIAHWIKHSYFPATIIRFIKEDMTFEIRWDDEDESGRFPPLTMVALNKVPNPQDIAVGTRVFFPQGSYRGEEGVRTGGMRYHEGIVKRIEHCSSNRLRCYGEHSKGANDGKWVTYSGYALEFCCFAEDLRVAPNPYDVLHAYG